MHTEYDDNDTPANLATIDTGALMALERASIDGQIATAHAFPRSMAAFIKEARALVSLDQDTAEACIYSLRRKENGKTKFITGPSVRFAEVIMHSYGNNRVGGRVVSTEQDQVVGQGVFHDLEKNVMVTKEVGRRIIDSLGRRYGADMIQVTGNAAISLALRNAVLAGIPKAIWLPIYEAAKMVAVGDISTLASRRGLALQWFVKAGVTEAQVLAKLELEGVEDIGIDELETLTGIKTAIRGGHMTIDQAFAPEQQSTSDKIAGLAERVQAARNGQVDKTTGELKATEPTTLEPSKEYAPDGTKVKTTEGVAADAPLPDGPLFNTEPGANA